MYEHDNISDLAPRYFANQDGMTQYTTRQTRYADLLQKKYTKMERSTLSPVQEFLEALGKVSRCNKDTFQVLESLAEKIDTYFPNTIQYRSPVGMTYGYEYYTIQIRITNQKQANEKIKKLFEEAKSEISPFDIIRYSRYIDKLARIET
jgi:hypothetical protein